MDALERGSKIYYRYFMHKWRTSLRKKRSLFPDLHTYDDSTLAVRNRITVERDGAFEHSERDVNTDNGAGAFATRFSGEISKSAPEIKDTHTLQRCRQHRT
jgi:hypothetical protein